MNLRFLAACLALVCIGGCTASSEEEAQGPNTGLADGADSELNLLRRMNWSFEGTLPKGTGMEMHPYVEGGYLPFSGPRGESKFLAGAFEEAISGERWSLDGRWRTKHIGFSVGVAGVMYEMGWLTFFTPFFDGYEWQSREDVEKYKREMITVADDGRVTVRIVKSGGQYAFAGATGTSGSKSYLSFMLPKKSTPIQVDLVLDDDVKAEIEAAYAAGRRPEKAEPNGS